MISIISYTGPDAPFMARQMVIELRQEPYRLPAYVYNFGAEERRKEYERVKALIEQQRRVFPGQQSAARSAAATSGTCAVEEQCGVLLGGYANEQHARRALENLRKLRPLDSARVQLHSTVSGTFDPANPNRVDQTESTHINPFLQAFLVRNPTQKIERPSEWDQLDVHVLKKLNADEPFSLFKCPRPITLAVTQFQTPTVVQPKSATGAFLENIGLAKKTPQQVDSAALNAHSLAEVLTKSCGLKAYVLHTQYSSVVTVGEFDSPQDPELLDMQSRLSSAACGWAIYPCFPCRCRWRYLTEIQ